MQATLARGTEVYRRTHVQSRSPLELVVMLYSGCIRFTAQARDAIDRGDLAARRDGINRALDIISELQTTLNMRDGGDLANALDGMYTYLTNCLLEGTVHGDRGALDEAVKLLTTLRDAWAQVAEPAAAPITQGICA